MFNFTLLLVYFSQLKPHYDEDDTDVSEESPAAAVSHVQDMHRILANRDCRRGQQHGRGGGVREPVVNSCVEGTDNGHFENDTLSETTPLLSDTGSVYTEVDLSHTKPPGEISLS